MWESDTYIQACKEPVDVDQPYKKGCAVTFPSSLVDEGGEDEFGRVVISCLSRHRDKYGEERYQ